MDSRLLNDRYCHTVGLGDVYASDAPSVLRTTLGSCIAVCLFDPKRKIGGMNHFMLPSGVDSCFDRVLPTTNSGDGVDPLTAMRFGVNAMELLINECMRLGADRYALVAKVFGGGHVLATADGSNTVPKRNVRFIEGFLDREQIPVLAMSTGGFTMRKVFFITDTGCAYVRSSRIDRVQRMAREVSEAELVYERRLMEHRQDENAVTFF